MHREGLDGTDARSKRRTFTIVSLAFGAVATLASTDLAMDLAEGTTLQHTILEGIILLLACLGIAFGLRQLLALRRSERNAIREASELQSRLKDSLADAGRWRAEARDLSLGLGTKIDEQFNRWDLSQAERNVALLTLKGFSHKDIASIRGVGAATVRQQGTAVYRKAGVDGRHGLSAFFLEDLLAPREQPAVETSPSLPASLLKRHPGPTARDVQLP